MGESNILIRDKLIASQQMLQQCNESFTLAQDDQSSQVKHIKQKWEMEKANHISKLDQCRKLASVFLAPARFVDKCPIVDLGLETEANSLLYLCRKKMQKIEEEVDLFGKECNHSLFKAQQARKQCNDSLVTAYKKEKQYNDSLIKIQQASKQCKDTLVKVQSTGSLTLNEYIEQVDHLRNKLKRIKKYNIILPRNTCP